MKKIFFIIVLVSYTLIKAQTTAEIFPDDLTIQPFTANFLEPKLGFLFNIGDNELRLDIGNSIDVLRVETEDNQTFSCGADLFTYTFLRGEENFHFPVDAVDYLFGVNFGYVNTSGCNEYGARLRVSHISAHFVDGHFDGTNSQWLDGRSPQVYSREFIELIPYYKFDDLRLYAGFTYVFHIDPAWLGKDIMQVGFDYFMHDMISPNITPFAAYDLRIVDLDKKHFNHSASVGVKLGKPYGKGFSIYLHHYSGKSIHGEYFDVGKTYTSLGLNLDL